MGEVWIRTYYSQGCGIQIHVYASSGGTLCQWSGVASVGIFSRDTRCISPVLRRLECEPLKRRTGPPPLPSSDCDASWAFYSGTLGLEISVVSRSQRLHF